MDDKIKFCPVQITTENVASYLSNTMLKMDDDFDSIEAVMAYLDNTIELDGRDDFYLNVLQSNRGINLERQLVFDVFDTEEDVFENIKKYDLHLINRGYEYYLGIDNVADEEDACKLVFSYYLENKGEYL